MRIKVTLGYFSLCGRYWLSLPAQHPSPLLLARISTWPLESCSFPTLRPYWLSQSWLHFQVSRMDTWLALACDPSASHEIQFLDLYLNLGGKSSLFAKVLSWWEVVLELGSCPAITRAVPAWKWSHARREWIKEMDEDWLDIWIQPYLKLLTPGNMYLY